MCRLTDGVGLLTQAQWDLEHDESREVLDVLELYRLLELECTNPQDSPELTKLTGQLAWKL
jgi:hypothetical protein